MQRPEQPERPELDSSNFNAADEDHIYKISVWMDLAYSFIKLHFPMDTRQNKAPSPYAKQTSLRLAFQIPGTSISNLS